MIRQSRQKALDADPRAIQQINFTANLDRADDTRVYFSRRYKSLLHSGRIKRN